MIVSYTIEPCPPPCCSAKCQTSRSDARAGAHCNEGAVVQFRLIAVGRLREPYLAAAAADFRQRLGAYHRIEETEVRAADGERPAEAIAREGAAVLRHIAPADQVWLLERTGTEFSSTEIAQKLERLAVDGVSRISFVIAGTYGAAPELLARADVRWSLSKLTFLHEWARVLVLEQLYRATKIAKNEPYHH